MKALIYLTKRSLINKTKRAVRKPVSLFMIIFGILYTFFILAALAGAAVNLRIDSPKGFLVLTIAGRMFMNLMGFHSIASRKGVIFKPYHSHFIFPAPIDSKVILFHGNALGYIFSLCVVTVFFVAGITVFQIEIWKMLLYVFVSGVLETIMETSFIVYIYSNERLSQKAIKWISSLIKLALIFIILYIALHFKINGISVGTAFSFIDLPELQMIPVVGWNIAVYRLVIIGPTVLNVVCSVLYVLTVLIIFLAARHMKCEGEYYEDAAKFADHVAELKERSKNSETFGGTRLKKKKYRHISDGVKGTGARAIFYRQLLEYRKEKSFIFTPTTLMVLVGSVMFSQIFRERAIESGRAQFYLLGVTMYVALLLSGVLGKWGNELKSHYLFLIPDSPVKKLWYSTLMEYIKALVDGCVFCIPIGVLWGINPVQIVSVVLLYIMLHVQRIYTKIIVQCMLGSTFGKKGQEIVRVSIQMFLMGGGIIAAFFVGVAVNLDLVFPIILIYSIIITVIVGLLASIRFGSMEQTD